MTSDNKQAQIRTEMFTSLGLTDIDPMDRTLWACVCVMSQMSEALHLIYLHRNCDRRYAAVVQMYQRAGRLAYKLRKELPQRGSVEFIEGGIDSELAEALQYLFLAASGERPSLQALALKMLRMTAGEAADSEDDLDTDEDDEFREWEALSDEALTRFEQDLESAAVDDLRRRDHADGELPDAGDAGGGLGDGGNGVRSGDAL